LTSNISYADTFSLAVRIAQAFAEQGPAPARRRDRHVTWSQRRRPAEK
jgi:hypothetical protein